MKKITQTEINRFIKLTSGASYNEEAKEEYKKLGRKILNVIAERMGLIKGEFDIRWNPGGIACSGDHTLHTDKVYLALHDNLGFGWFYYRSCKGRKDYTGGSNQNCNWKMLEFGLDTLVKKLNDIHHHDRTPQYTTMDSTIIPLLVS